MSVAECEFIFRTWHERARGRDVEGLLALYAQDAVFESPLVAAITPELESPIRGVAQLRTFLTEGTRRRPDDLVRWYRTGRYLCDGRTIFWEYPRATPDGDQIDIAEVMDVDEGLITHHRIYWGAFGVARLVNSARSADGDR